VIEAAYPNLKQPILRLIDHDSQMEKGLIEELLKIEQELTAVDFKFGVLYCKKGQTHEGEMFGNGLFSFLSGFLPSYIELKIK